MDAKGYVRSSNVEFQQIDDEGILLDMESGRYYRLNETATEVWKTLENPASISAITDRLSDVYAAPPREIVDDVEQVLKDMTNMGVVAEAEELPA